jgi:prepilin-type N-terminal cleavage/methylation domain-containing protein
VLDRSGARGFTLLEVLLVIGLLAALAALAMPVMFGELSRRELTESAENVRSLVVMARANAMISGNRYRIRWDAEWRQPIVEHEPDAVGAPEEFVAVQASWARDDVLLREINCYEVWLGRPVQYELVVEEAEDDSSEQDQVEEDLTEDEFGRPTLLFDATGRVDWATFVIAKGQVDELAEDAEQLWVVVDGRTGQVLIERPLDEESLAEMQIDRAKLLKPLDEWDRTLTVEQEDGGGGGASGMAMPDPSDFQELLE